ncbi:hypothetical protein RM69_08045 [Mesotoga sp. SC_NapDC3]|nr:hypothetical protein RM69_08045 [Mesotoga sp. SC_NapDC3]PXF33650.1 hypothetical protein EU77_12375 [Mesotoga sp. SC_NapDC]
MKIFISTPLEMKGSEALRISIFTYPSPLNRTSPLVSDDLGMHCLDTGRQEHCMFQAAMQNALLC